MINPASNCIYTSYSDDLANDFSKEIREIVESEAFRKFTGIEFKKDKKGADYWVTSAGGGFRAAPLGGSLVGYGFGVSGDEFGGFACVDDPNKPGLVKSQTEMQNYIDLYESSLKTRANNKAKSPILLVMQRVGIDDLAGYILANEADDWEVIKIPALNEETGVALWEEKFPAKELLKLKKQNPFLYYSMYQQEPIVVGGSVYKTEWFRYYNTTEEYFYQFSFITADTAQKKGEGNDFTVLEYWAKTVDNKLHLIDMVRGKFDAEELRQQILLFWNKWKDGVGNNNYKCPPYGFYIEDKSSGIGVLQEMKKNHPIPVIPISRNRYKDDSGLWKAQDKFTRAMTAIPYIANGWVYLPNSEKDDISSIILGEAAAFKADLSHKHDDTCFVGSTKIATLWGDKAIKDVKTGDYVITPNGIRKVLASKCTGKKKVIEKFGIRATPNHKFYSQNSFKQFDSLDDVSQCDILSLKGELTWRYRSLLNSMEKNTSLWGRKGIISLSLIPIKDEKILKDFMWRFGNFIRERQFRKAMSFITKTITLTITTSLILSAYHVGNIWNYIKKIYVDGREVKSVKNIWKPLDLWLQRHTKLKNSEKKAQKELKNGWLKSDNGEFAKDVEENLKFVQTPQSAKDVVTPNGGETNGDVEKVYNLTVTSDNVYYANGTLVSNCDCLNDAIDIAFGSSGVGSIFI